MKFLNEEKTSWEYRGRTMSINLSDIQNTKYFERAEVIGYLVGKVKYNPEKLVVYSMDGKLQNEISPPEGYQFGYLTSYYDAEIAVICGVIDYANSNEVCRDFYFGLDLETGLLSRLGIAR